MASLIRYCSLAALCLAMAAPAAAAEAAPKPRTAPALADADGSSGVGAPLSDAQLRDTRGGDSLLGLPDGTTVFAQIGGQVRSDANPDAVGLSTMVFSDGGTSLAGTATLGTSGGVDFVASTVWSQTQSMVTTHTPIGF